MRLKWTLGLGGRGRNAWQGSGTVGRSVRAFMECAQMSESDDSVSHVGRRKGHVHNEDIKEVRKGKVEDRTRR